jgi:hypothetical protein
MKAPVNGKDQLVLAGILVVTVLSRIPFRARIPYGLDSIQFVLGVNHYDVRIHQPHPPGYFLFVMMGRWLNTFLQDPNLSFIALNIALSTLAVWLVFCLAREMFGVRSAFASLLLMATSPVFWFHGEVALSNAADCFFVCLLALFCWRNLNNNYRRIYLSAVVLGLAGGIRQNTLLFMLPLWILSIRGAGLRKGLLSFVILILTVSSWYLPMASLSGGIGAYQLALRDHWLNSNWHGFSPEWIPFNFLCVAYFILLGTGPGVSFLLLGALFHFERIKLPSLSGDPTFQFFTAWLLPPLGFFIFIYSHPIQTGHSLIYLPALLILMPRCVQLNCEQVKRLFRPNEMQLRAGEVTPQRNGDLTLLPVVRFSPSQVLLVILVGCNLFMFLAINTAVSQSAIRKYELRVAELVAQVEAHWSPRQAVLISCDFMFLGFRDFMFHLPEYHTYQPKLYSLGGQDLVFAGFRRETQLVEEIVVPSEVECFVLNADEFVKNPKLIHGIDLGRLPKESFLTTPSGFRLFRGEIQDLPKLFPQVHIKLQ